MFGGAHHTCEHGGRWGELARHLAGFCAAQMLSRAHLDGERVVLETRDDLGHDPDPAVLGWDRRVLDGSARIRGR